MKKIILAIFLLFTINCSEVRAEQTMYKVIKVIDGDTVYVDFNQNGLPEQEEKVRLNSIEIYET